MPVYTYSALDERGKETKGVVNADSARGARVKLRQSGLFTKALLETAAAETPERNRRLALRQTMRRVRPQDITVMMRQFATLLSASLTVVDALTALIEQTENRTLQRTLIQVRESILEGRAWRRLSSSIDVSLRSSSSTWCGPERPAVPCPW